MPPTSAFEQAALPNSAPSWVLAPPARMTLQKFVELTATNPAKAYGLHPRKGAIAIGSDADLVVWDEREFVLHNADLHHAVDHTPYEGMTLRAWPEITIARGKVIWDGKAFHGQAGRGHFLKRGAPTLLPRGQEGSA